MLQPFLGWSIDFYDVPADADATSDDNRLPPAVFQAWKCFCFLQNFTNAKGHSKILLFLTNMGTRIFRHSNFDEKNQNASKFLVLTISSFMNMKTIFQLYLYCTQADQCCMMYPKRFDLYKLYTIMYSHTGIIWSLGFHHPLRGNSICLDYNVIDFLLLRQNYREKNAGAFRFKTPLSWSSASLDYNEIALLPLRQNYGEKHAGAFGLHNPLPGSSACLDYNDIASLCLRQNHREKNTGAFRFHHPLRGISVCLDYNEIALLFLRQSYRETNAGAFESHHPLHGSSACLDDNEIALPLLLTSKGPF